jgi:hypothetical protein
MLAVIGVEFSNDRLPIVEPLDKELLTTNDCTTVHVFAYDTPDSDDAFLSHLTHAKVSNTREASNSPCGGKDLPPGRNPIIGHYCHI